MTAGAETRQCHRLAGTALASVAAGTVAIGLLQVLPPTRAISPLSEPISAYALTRLGWLFDAGVAVLAFGLLVVIVSLVKGRHIATRSAAFVALVCCGAGMAAVVIFPYEVIAGRLTTIGWVHTAASLVVFAGPPVAPLTLTWRRAPRCSRLLTAARWLAVAAAGSLVVLLGCSLLAWTSILPAWQVGGLVERCLATAEIAIALLLGAWIWRSGPATADPAREPDPAHAHREPAA